jgi:hypothetical protein
MKKQIQYGTMYCDITRNATADRTFWHRIHTREGKASHFPLRLN